MIQFLSFILNEHSKHVCREKNLDGAKQNNCKGRVNCNIGMNRMKTIDVNILLDIKCNTARHVCLWLALKLSAISNYILFCAQLNNPDRRTDSINQFNKVRIMTLSLELHSNREIIMTVNLADSREMKISVSDILARKKVEK